MNAKEATVANTNVSFVITVCSIASRALLQSLEKTVANMNVSFVITVSLIANHNYTAIVVMAVGVYRLHILFCSTIFLMIVTSFHHKKLPLYDLSGFRLVCCCLFYWGTGLIT